MMRRSAAGLLAAALPALGDREHRAAANQNSAAYRGAHEQLLDDVQRAAFDFFWSEASPTTGQVKDRALANGNDLRKMSSIAATGFGLSGLCIADRRGYGKSAEIRERVRKTLRFVLDQMPHEHGFFYHFVDMETGKRWGKCEVSSIDSSLLLCGVLTARQHFADEEIKDFATKIYERVDWPWMLNGESTFSMGLVIGHFQIYCIPAPSIMVTYRSTGRLVNVSMRPLGWGHRISCNNTLNARAILRARRRSQKNRAAKQQGGMETAATVPHFLAPWRSTSEQVMH